MSIKLTEAQQGALTGVKEVVVSAVNGNDITVVNGSLVFQLTAPEGHKVKFGQVVKIKDNAFQIEQPVAAKGKLNPSNKDLRAMGF